MSDPDHPYDGNPISGVPAMPANENNFTNLDYSATSQNRDDVDPSSAAAQPTGDDVAAVMKLLQETLPKLSNTFHTPLGQSPNQSPSRPPSEASTAHVSPIRAVSPYIFIGHQVPPFPGVVPVGSVPKDFPYSYVPYLNSSKVSAPLLPAGGHAQSGAAPLMWQHGSCILYPSMYERAPLLGSVARSDVLGQGGNIGLPGNTIPSDSAPSRTKCRFSRKQILTLVSMLLVDVASFASMSILAPFFPHQAQKLNLGPTLDGIIFSVYAFVIVVASPLIGKVLPVMNSRTVYLVGILVAAISNICFGMVQYVTTPEVFVILTITLRIITALGTAAFLTVIYSVVPVLFPDDLNMVNGMMETAVGIGMCVGPAIGVWLFSIGGFCLPFYGLGGFVVLSLFINYITFPYDEVGLVQLNESGGVMKVLWRQGAILPLTVLCGTAASLALLYPTLQPHMSKLGVSVEGVGLVFLLMSAVYAVSSPLVGLATDRFNCPWGFMFSGLLIMAVALVLLGNSPLLPDVPYKELYNQDVIAIVLLGFSSAMCIVPTYAAILQSTTREGHVVDKATYAVVGGLWSSSYSLGEMLGPLLAGVMAEYINFAASTTVTAILPVALAVICGAFMCVARLRSRKMSTT